MAVAKRLWLEFERGGQFPVELFTDVAPRNTHALWDASPLSGDALHCLWSGQGLFCKVDDFPVAPENQQMIGLEPGTLTIEYYPPGLRSQGPRTSLLLVYGRLFSFKNPYTVSWPLCVVGKVTEGLDQFPALGERFRRLGMEKMTVRRAD